MLEARCHCGAVRIEVPRKPRSLTNCNCSICRRYGVLWAYFKDSDVKLIAPEGATDHYPTAGRCRRPYPLESKLHVRLMQN